MRSHSRITCSHTRGGGVTLHSPSQHKIETLWEWLEEVMRGVRDVVCWLYLLYLRCAAESLTECVVLGRQSLTTGHTDVTSVHWAARTHGSHLDTDTSLCRYLDISQLRLDIKSGAPTLEGCMQLLILYSVLSTSFLPPPHSPRPPSLPFFLPLHLHLYSPHYSHCIRYVLCAGIENTGRIILLKSLLNILFH